MCGILRKQTSAKHRKDKRLWSKELTITCRSAGYGTGIADPRKVTKFARPFHSPFRVTSLTPILNEPRSDPIFMSLNRVRPYYDEPPDLT